jgi:hypothetical protein
MDWDSDGGAQMEKKRRGARREEKHSNEKKNPCE